MNSKEGVSINITSETEPLLHSSKRVVITVPPATPEKAPTPSHSHTKQATTPNNGSFKGGIAIMLFLTFLSSVTFSIVLPSVWPFIQAIEKANHKEAQQSLVGWACAANSAGSFLASPLIGAWADKRPTREVIAATLILMIGGNVLYALSWNIYILFTARFLVGVASSNYAVAQMYLSYASTQQSRTLVMALNSACTVLGFIVGPSFSLALNYINFSIKEVKVNYYTGPGYLAGIFSLLALCSLVFLREIPPSYKRTRKPQNLTGSTAGSGFYAGQGSVKDISQVLQMRGKNLPVGGILICLFGYFTYTLSFTVFETIGTPYTQTAFKWGVLYNSILYVALGFLCVISLMILQIFVKLFKDRASLIGATLLSVAGYGILIDLKTQYVHFARFASGAALGSAAYATGAALITSIYSKILEGLDQGVMMGWLSSAGSVSRIVGPLMASYTLQYAGASYVMLEVVSLQGLAAICFLIGFRKLVPREKQLTEEKPNINDA